MIVDIGGGSTEIAVISLGGIVSNNSIRTAGDDLTADIQEYMSRQHNVKVSERMAERIKIHVGSALTDPGDEAPEDFIVHGPNRITALPMEVLVCYQEIAHCPDKTVAKIENAVLSALENTPPELYADIVKNGIRLSVVVLCSAVSTSVCRIRSISHSTLQKIHCTVLPRVLVLR